MRNYLIGFRAAIQAMRGRKGWKIPLIDQPAVFAKEACKLYMCACRLHVLSEDGAGPGNAKGGARLFSCRTAWLVAWLAGGREIQLVMSCGTMRVFSLMQRVRDCRDAAYGEVADNATLHKLNPVNRQHLSNFVRQTRMVTIDRR